MKIFLPLYAAALLLLTPSLSLWLDEILTLIGAVQPDTSSLLGYIKTVPGGSPLAFLLPRWTIQLLGYSVFSARLTSALASIAACPAIYLLARRLNLRIPLLAVVVFALWPLQLRYAMEARPYALALALTAWSTEIFLSLSARRARTWLYVLLTALAALAQPYALFVPAAHLTWAVFYQRSSLRAPVAALAVAALTLLPWYLHFQSDWARVTSDQQLSTWDLLSPLVFVHEIAGSGYFGTALLATGVALGLRQLSEPRQFWLLQSIVPILGVFTANAVLHYFFAIRQTIYILPALAILFVAGTTRSSRSGLLLLVFLAASIYEDINWFRKPRENWQAAADVIQREVNAGACVKFLGDSAPVYEFFYPSLAQHHCAGPTNHIVVGTSAYVTPTDEPIVGDLPFTSQDFNGPAVIIGKR